MKTNQTSVIYRPLIVLTLMVMITSACAGTALGSTNAVPGALLLSNGLIQMVDQNGKTVPVAGASTVELVGTVDSTDPWMVAGRKLEITDSTQIEDGLQKGDLVRVRGSVLEETVWLAYSIERAEEQTDATVDLVGKVDSVDPWVVDGMKLDVTDQTVINGDIKPGTVVRVQVLLNEDGTWEVLNITPVGDAVEPPASGCVTVTAKVVSVNGNVVRFEGWPEVTLGDNVIIKDSTGADATLSPGQEAQVVACATDNGQIAISQITLLADDAGDESAGQKKVLICHKPDKKGGHTLSVAEPAAPAHLAHGDTLGACP